MSTNTTSLEGPLLQEDTFTGRVFHISLPKTGELNCSWLETELEGTLITLESSVDLTDRDDIHIPDVFESGIDDGAQVATIQNVQEFHQGRVNGVIGYLAHNEPDTVKFDDKEIFVLDQQQTRFLVFEFSGQAFLLIVTPREHLNTLHPLLADVLKDHGLIVDEISISHNEFEDIAEDLIDTHLMTAVEDYEDSTIHKKQIVGRGYGQAEEYQREKRQGSVRGQRFGTSQLDGRSKTIQISGDCLIRSYHKITLSTYIAMLTTYIIPNLSLTVQASVSWYGSENFRIGIDRVTED